MSICSEGRVRTCNLEVMSLASVLLLLFAMFRDSVKIRTSAGLLPEPKIKESYLLTQKSIKVYERPFSKFLLQIYNLFS